MEVMDVKFISFITLTLLNEHYFVLHRPKIYYWTIQEFNQDRG